MGIVMPITSNFRLVSIADYRTATKKAASMGGFFL